MWKKVAFCLLLIKSKLPPVKRVLIVDDDDISHLIVIKNIEVNVFAQNVKEVWSGRDALIELYNCYAGASRFPDVIFLDINMPGMSGWEFLNEYAKLPQKALRHTKIVMLTSSNAPRDIEKAKENALVYDYIEKPISAIKLEQLSAKIRAED